MYEALKNFEKSEQYYTNGLLMLELLKSDATEESDKDILKNCILIISIVSYIFYRYSQLFKEII